MNSAPRHPTLETRRLSLSDLEPMNRIEQRVYAEPWSEQLLRESLEAPMTYAFGLFYSAELRAYAVFQIVLEESHLLNIAVHPEHQGFGFGSHLLEKVLDFAQEKGAKRLFLEVRPSNQRARDLYKSRGFVTLHRRENYYQNGEDALVLFIDLPR